MYTDKVFEEHKSIRNKIQKYDPYSLLSICMGTLFKTESKLETMQVYVPWEMMLLVRWTLQYRTVVHKPKLAKQSDMHLLLNMIKELYGRDNLLTEGGGHALNKFMRRTALQQFAYQLGDHHVTMSIGRHIILYEDLASKLGVDIQIIESVGLTVKEFLIGMMGVYVHTILGERQVLKASVFRDTLTEGKAKLFLDCISKDISELQGYLAEDTARKKHRFSLHLYEVTPLSRYPFFRDGDKYICYSKRLFRYSLSYILDDILMSSIKDGKRKFGKILEQYVEDRLGELQLNYIKDSGLQKLISSQPQLPDYTIPFDDGVVFIEVKSKQLDLMPRVFQTNDVLANNLDDSLVKGVVQIFSGAHQLRRHSVDGVANTDKFYGIVVSYKEHYFNGGKSFWDEFLKNAVEAELNKIGVSVDLIDPDNIYLLSIEEFDYLAKFLKDHPSVSIIQVLDQVKEFGANQETASIFFHAHLRRISPKNTVGVPDHLRLKAVGIPDAMLDMIEANNPNLMKIRRVRVDS